MSDHSPINVDDVLEETYDMTDDQAVKRLRKLANDMDVYAHQLKRMIDSANQRIARLEDQELMFIKRWESSKMECDALKTENIKLTQALTDARNEFSRSDMVHDCYYAPQTSGTQIREWEELIKQNTKLNGAS